MLTPGDDQATKPLKVLYLATTFPKPTNPSMGIWALDQARALVRAGVDLSVMSPTSWVPRIVARSATLRAWAHCPRVNDFDSLRVEYPRWMFYHADPLRRWAYPRPRLQNEIGWLTVRRALTRHIRERRLDVIYAHHMEWSGHLAQKLYQSHGMPYVVTEHDLEVVVSCEHLPRRKQYFSRVIRDASAIHVESRQMETAFRQLFPDAPLVVIPAGSDPIPATFQNVPRPAELEGRLVILAVGGFYQRKGYPVLVRAFARIAPNFPNAILRIIGGGSEPAIDAAIAETAMGERVQLLGAKDHDRVLQEMIWCDAYALLSWNEPFGVSYAEAMSAGKPIVCTNESGIADTIQDGVQGFIVPPRDVEAAAAALTRLLECEARRLEMGAAAKRLFDERLTWDANARAIISLLERAVATE